MRNSQKKTGKPVSYTHLDVYKRQALEETNNNLKIAVMRLKKQVAELEKEMKQLRLKTSMVFQNYNIFKNKTVIENVMSVSYTHLQIRG